MESIKLRDFVELEYVGRLSNGRLFDTNIKEVGEKEHLHKHDYNPLFVCVGERFVIKGLDKRLEGCQEDKVYTFNIPAEEAYGKKDPKLVRVVSKSLFTKQKMNPYPGMQINAEGMAGLIRSVSGGRVFVDFNHPLAGKELIFEIKVTKIIKDVKEKVEGLLKSFMMLPQDKYNFDVMDENLKIEVDFEMPSNMINFFKDKVLKMIPEIKSIEFSVKKKESTTSE